MKSSLLKLVLVATGMFSVSVRADVTPATIFQSNMVLPRECPVPVWGQADPGEQVEVQISGQVQKTKADKYGRWQVTLSPLQINKTGLKMVLKGKNRVILSNILVGDVWLCGGQSNMEMMFRSKVLEGDKHMKESIHYPLIRRVKVAHLEANDPSENVVIQHNWSVCSPKNIPYWSAAAYYFARRVHKETGIPIGLLESNKGGTPIVLFTASEGYDAEKNKGYWTLSQPYIPGTPEYKKRIREKIRLHKEWVSMAEEMLESGGTVPSFPAEPKRKGSISLYFNAMIAPLVRFPIKGVIWYQGCSDARSRMAYYQKMHELVGGWRKAWKYDFPFYYVQLASFFKATNDPKGGNGYAYIRDAQLKAMDLPNSGMACAIDIGMQNDIHPKNKYDVGERLALWALRDTYGKKDVVVSGPLFKSMEIKDGRVILSFNYAKGLMTAKKNGIAKPVPVKEKPAHFAIAGSDKIWHWADAKIVGEKIVLSSDKVKSPVAVRYAFRAYPDGVNMYNAAGLPMVPFRTDNW